MGHKHTEETKLRLSLKRKEWLKNNKDKHNWNYNKNKSIPCEILKLKLKELSISFVDEYIPFNDKYYSIDIAFPDRKIGIEINGNQHYNKIGKLSPYYQIRHDFLESRMWKIYEFHYSAVYNGDLINNILNILEKSDVITDFDYHFWILNRKTKNEQYKKRLEERRKLRKQKVNDTIQQLKNSTINFHKFGWVEEASKIIGISPQKVNKWMKMNMLDFYNEKCFKRINLAL